MGTPWRMALQLQGATAATLSGTCNCLASPLLATQLEHSKAWILHVRGSGSRREPRPYTTSFRGRMHGECLHTGNAAPGMAGLCCRLCACPWVRFLLPEAWMTTHIGHNWTPLRPPAHIPSEQEWLNAAFPPTVASKATQVPVCELQGTEPHDGFRRTAAGNALAGARLRAAILKLWSCTCVHASIQSLEGGMHVAPRCTWALVDGCVRSLRSKTPPCSSPLQYLTLHYPTCVHSVQSVCKRTSTP